MEPITSSVIAGLVTRTLGGAAGSLPRLVKSRQKHEVRVAVEGLSATAQSFLLPALTVLTDRTDGAQEVVGTFLGSVEAEAFVRSVACAALSGQLTAVRGDLQDQLVALLVVVAKASRRTARELARLLLDLFVKTIDTASRQLARADRQLFDAVGGRARAEREAGSLAGIVQRSGRLRRHTPAELTDYFDFADEYRALLHERTSELIPAYFDVQQRVPIGMFYMRPRFATDHGEETLSSFLAHGFRTVILGDPGAGKSALAQHLAHHYSAAREVADFGIVPFVVQLRTYQAWKKQQHGSILDFIEASIMETYQLTPPKGAVEYLMLAGRAFVLFDGLDELLDLEARHNVCMAIANFADLYADTTVFVTARKIGYAEAPVNPNRFRTVSLLSFTEQDVHAYVTTWFNADNRLDTPTRSAMIRSFLSESLSVPDLRTNALMLVLMCNLYRSVHTIPQNRADLYEKCAEMLFEQWDASRGIASPQVLKTDAKAALQDVALWMYATPKLTGGVTEKQLVHRLTEFWGKRFEDRQRAADTAKELIALWRGRTGVLTDIGTSGHQVLYRFSHQTFLEFFAAVETVRRNPSPEALWRHLRAAISETRRDVVAQIAIQKLDQFYLDGADAVLNLLLDDARQTQSLKARCNLMAFATRNVDNLYALPATKRRLVDAAVDLALETMPTSFSTSPQHYVDHVDTLTKSGAIERRYYRTDPLEPIVRLLRGAGDRQASVTDQVLRHCRELVTANSAHTPAVAAFLLLRPTFDAFADGPLWTSSQIEEALGEPITPDRVRMWSETNSWVAVLAHRESLITVTDLIRFAGVASLACAVDPTSGLGTGLTRRYSPLEGLLLVHLGHVEPEDECTYTNTQARDALVTVARQLSAGLPAFDQSGFYEQDLLARMIERPGKTNNVVEPSRLADPEVGFAAAMLLAALLDLGEWDVTHQYNDDQLDPDAFGALRVLAPVFRARTAEVFPSTEVDDALQRSGLTPAQQQVLAAWARNQISLAKS